VFRPLSRVALKVLLQSTRLTVREADVVRSVAWWARHSPWVRTNVEAGELTADLMTDITSLLNPAQLSGPEFKAHEHIFPQATHKEVRGVGGSRVCGRCR